MQKRIVIKLGDIFVVKTEDYQKYFQYMADDMTMLNSSVIRAFREKYPLGSVPDLKEVINGEVEFYAHTSIKLGIKIGLWGKTGNVPIVRDINVVFCRSRDYTEGIKVKISDRWEIWHANEDFSYVGKLQGENRKAEIGIVEPPNEIVERMRTGKYSYYYPGFE